MVPRATCCFRVSAGTFLLVYTLLNLSQICSPTRSSNPFPLLWKHSLNYWTPREVPKRIFFVMSVLIEGAKQLLG